MWLSNFGGNDMQSTFSRRGPFLLFIFLAASTFVGHHYFRLAVYPLLLTGAILQIAVGFIFSRSPAVNFELIKVSVGLVLSNIAILVMLFIFVPGLLDSKNASQFYLGLFPKIVWFSGNLMNAIFMIIALCAPAFISVRPRPASSGRS